ncbi:DNA topoisomerase 3 [Sutterella massiliensis]|uniref:DNA topoisomerase n=1 Tax=Sutterella massiliensis TaxID=1816689 RepID=A0ABS2DPY1_9BURK|nr:DNA topoisomerase 3 [Sutterella massiliensis]MBM6703401.1 DNA topoisomerase 3 [Sutterella massiliensis]
MRLFIAEKPSVAKAIVAELGSASRGDGFITCKEGSVVTWCFGHLLEQAEPDAYLPDDVPRTKKGSKVWRFEDLPIFPKTWKLLPKNDKGVKKQLATIGKLLKKASLVVHAGDPDREGQLLVDEVLEHFRYTGRALRFWVSAQDSVSIRKGLANLQDNGKFVGMKWAALGRSRADWLLGMNLSRAYTLTEGKKELIAVGRVQTPTLALVAKRDAAIRHFKPVPYFIIKARLGSDKPFTAVWEPGDSQTGVDEQKRLVDRGIAVALQQRLNTVNQATVVSYSRTPKKIAQPKAFSLADIQLAASNHFGFSAEKTLSVCQSLYETHKATSYPRTDCSFLPESQHADARNVLAAIAKTIPSLAGIVAKCDCSIKSPTWNDKKITAHHGIIPTQQATDGSKFNDAERKIYLLISERYLANFLPAHEYLACSIELRIATERFSAKGRLVTKLGWKAVTGAADEDKTDDEGQALPELKAGLQVPVSGIECKEERTKPPAAFTEGTLIRAMENIHQAVDDPQSKKFLKEGDGIGTPATRAAIIAELKRKKYLEAKGKKIVATELGVHLLQVVPDVMKNPVLTALFERILREVEAGKVPLGVFIEKQKQLVINELNRLRK